MTEILEMSKGERNAYDASLKALRDNYSMLMTAREEGRARGFEKGRAEALAEARSRMAGRSEFLTRLFTRKFGPQALTPALQQRLQSATVDQMDRWGERLLDAQGVDEVFREP